MLVSCQNFTTDPFGRLVCDNPTYYTESQLAAELAQYLAFPDYRMSAEMLAYLLPACTLIVFGMYQFKLFMQAYKFGFGER